MRMRNWTGVVQGCPLPNIKDNIAFWNIFIRHTFSYSLDWILHYQSVLRRGRLIEAQFRKIFLQSRLSELVTQRTAYIPKHRGVCTGPQSPQCQSLNCLPFKHGDVREHSWLLNLETQDSGLWKSLLFFLRTVFKYFIWKVNFMFPQNINLLFDKW